MTIIYDVAATDGALRQGDVIGPVWEHRAVYPPRLIAPGTQVAVRSIAHDVVIVLSPDCDLLWDYEMRFDYAETPRANDGGVDSHSSAVTHVLLCGLFSYDEIRPRFQNAADVWRRVAGNQDERYHRLSASLVGRPMDDGATLVMNDLYIDFKRVFSVPTERIYEGLLSQEIGRPAALRETYMHDLIHRFYGFLSRIAVEE